LYLFTSGTLKASSWDHWDKPWSAGL